VWGLRGIPGQSFGGDPPAAVAQFYPASPTVKLRAIALAMLTQSAGRHTFHRNQVNIRMRFYQAWRSEGQELPEALHTTQTWLHTSTNADFAAYFKQQLPEVASDGYRRFLWEQDPTAQPFAQPFYWAGFYYTGV